MSHHLSLEGKGAIAGISRFFGVIIRMYAEPGAPHHRPHFHAYCQNSVVIYSIDMIEPSAAPFLDANSASLKHGLNYTRMSYERTGNGCKRGKRPVRLHHSARRGG